VPDPLNLFMNIPVEREGQGARRGRGGRGPRCRWLGCPGCLWFWGAGGRGGGLLCLFGLGWFGLGAWLVGGWFVGWWLGLEAVLLGGLSEVVLW